MNRSVPRQITIRLDGPGGKVIKTIGEDELGELQIGRDERCGLPLFDPTISKLHCSIVRSEGRLWIQDLGSTGGTWLDGRQLSEPQPLLHGTACRIGRVSLFIEIAGADRLDEVLPPPPPVEPRSDPASAQPRIRNTVEAERSDQVDRGGAEPRDWYADDDDDDDEIRERPGVSPRGGRGGDTQLAGRHTPRTSADFEIELEGDAITIGRDDDDDAACDFVLDNPLISRRHATLRPHRDGGWSVEDLGSSNGTFVNGLPLSIRRPRHLEVGDTVGIGPYRMTFTGQRLAGRRIGNGARIEVRNLSVNAADRQTGKPIKLLDDVSLVIEPGEFVGLMGPVGCGKSTLMSSMNGRRLASSAAVFYDGEDLFENLDALKGSISYVPQQIGPHDAILHEALPVSDALRYVCRLRLPPDTTETDIDRGIKRVLRTVGLSDRATTAIRNLSGGQKKKVAIAMELLSRPRALLLDEVTAGMDLGNEQQAMQLFRNLAEGGLSVVCITHYVDRLKMCDMVAYFVRGRLAFYGPPEALKRYFGVDDIGDVFTSRPSAGEGDEYGGDAREVSGLDSEQEDRRAANLARRFRESREYQVYVRGRLRSGPATAERQRRAPSEFGQDDQKRQFAVLATRYAQLLRLDGFTTGMQLLAAPVIAALLCVLARSIDAPAKPVTFAEFAKYAAAQNILCFGSLLTTLFLGLFGSVREIVKELPIYRHERFVNLQVWPYLLSKAFPLAILGAAQAMMITLVTRAWGPLESGSVVQQFVILMLVAVCGVMLGLAVSAAVDTSDRAVMAMIVVVIPQVLFAGAAVPVDGASALISKSFITAYWAQRAMTGFYDDTVQRIIDPHGPAGGHGPWPATFVLMIHSLVYGATAYLLLAARDKR